MSRLFLYAGTSRNKRQNLQEPTIFDIMKERYPKYNIVNGRVFRAVQATEQNMLKNETTQMP